MYINASTFFLHAYRRITLKLFGYISVVTVIIKLYKWLIPWNHKQNHREEKKWSSAKCTGPDIKGEHTKAQRAKLVCIITVQMNMHNAECKCYALNEWQDISPFTRQVVQSQTVKSATNKLERDQEAVAKLRLMHVPAAFYCCTSLLHRGHTSFSCKKPFDKCFFF